MKRFALHLANVLTLMVIVNVALVFLVPPDSNAYLAAYNDKVARLDTLSQPRIILLGGSNVAFGLDSRMLADSLGCNVVNMALHAGIGMRWVMHDALPYIHPGDIVVLQMEYGNFFSSGNGEPETLPLLMMATHWRGFGEMNAAQRINVIKGMPLAAFANLKRLIKYPMTHTLDTQANSTHFVYARSGFNRFGDEASHWACPPQGQVVNAPCDVKPIDKDFLAWLQQEIAAYEQAGAVVLMVPPVSPQTNFQAHYAPTIAQALQAIGHPYVTAPQSMTVPDSLSFDGGYHVTRPAVILTSTRIIHLIPSVSLMPQHRCGHSLLFNKV